MGAGSSSPNAAHPMMAFPLPHPHLQTRSPCLSSPLSLQTVPSGPHFQKVKNESVSCNPMDHSMPGSSVSGIL